MKQTAMWTTLLLLVNIAPVQADTAEQDAIQAVQKLGGTVRSISADTDWKDVDFHLGGQDLTDEGLAHLAAIDNLVWLHLKDTKITDAGLKHLSGLSKLTRLHLEGTNITDAGLAHLASLENLEYLNVYGTKVSNAGLSKLKGLKKLNKLYVWQTKVTKEGVTDLKKSLPKLAVIGTPGDNPIDKFAAENAPPKKSLAKGQFIRVRIPGVDKVLSLAEVQVVQTGDGQNLQRDGKASQTSTHFKAKASRAKDGDTSQVFVDNSITHTLTEDNPFWLLDLGSVKDIGRIKIYNRKDCCGERLKGAIVEVLGADKKVLWSAMLAKVENGSVHDYLVK